MDIARRLTAELTAALAVPAAGSAYVASHLFPEDPGHVQARPLVVGMSLAVMMLGALIFWRLLAPVRAGLAAGAGEERRHQAGRAALRTPLRVSAAVGIAGTATAVGLAVSRIAAGRPVDAVVAGALVGLAFVIMATMLAYSVASAGLAKVLLELGPTGEEPGRVSMRSKVLATSAGLVCFALLLVGPIAYARYRADLDGDHLARAERALANAAAIAAQRGPAAAAEFASLATDAPAAVVDGGGAILSRSGGGDGSLLAAAGRPGRERLAGAWRLRRPLPDGRTLVILLPEAPLLARRAALWNASGLVGLAVLAAAFLLVWLVARGLTVPLRSLGRAAERVAAGDLTAAPPSVTRDEMGRLASDFRRMTQGLAALVREVQEASRGVLQGTREVEEIGGRVAEGAAEERAQVFGVQTAVQDMQASVALAGRGVAGLSEYVASTSSAVVEMSASLEEVRRQATELTKQAEGAARDVEGLAETGRRAQTQLGGIEEVAWHASESLQAVSASLRELESSSVSSQRAAARAAEMVEQAGTVVREAAEGIEGVRAAVGDAKQRITVLGRRSDDIDQILDFIGEVAGRTNLLSLNASIIATQAGEHGKAFAVVAGHIRELASQISSSTQSIGQILHAVRDDVRGTAQLIDRGDELAAGGVALAHKSLGALEEIRGATDRGRETAVAIQEALQVHANATREVGRLVAAVAEGSRGLAEAVTLVGRSVGGVGTVSRAVNGLADRVSRALEEQSGLGRRQLEALERINAMIAEVSRAMDRHAASTRSVEEALRQLTRTAQQHERSVGALGNVAGRLVSHSHALGERVGRFKVEG
jgi:methyl-accepting chemotaxis protein